MEYEQTADVLDLAAKVQDDLNNAGRAAVEQQLKPEKPEGFDGIHCYDCGDPLAPVRLAYKRCRCTPCQTELEHKEKMRGRR